MSKLGKYGKGIAVAVVFVGIIIATHNWTDSTLDDISPQKKKLSDLQAEADAHGTKVVELPEPIGSPEASVQIQVYVTTDNECDTTTLDGMKTIGSKYGDKVYIEFGDLLDDQTKVEAEKAKIGCKSGLTINGKSRFILPDRGLKGAVLFDGPVGEKNYTMKDVHDIVRHLLEVKGEIEPGDATADEDDAEEHGAEEDPHTH